MEIQKHPTCINHKYEINTVQLNIKSEPEWGRGILHISKD
jgi:hypothetical protein